jgi:YVTN family beta-propeller protein
MTTQAEALAAADAARAWIAGVQIQPPPPPQFGTPGTRIPFHAQTLGTPLLPPLTRSARQAQWAAERAAPAQQPCNAYPHSICTDGVHVYLSSVGGNAATGYVGTARVEKFRCTDGVKIGQTDIGPYNGPNGTYLNGCGGIAIGHGKLWVAQTLGAGEVIAIDPASMQILSRTVTGYLTRDVWVDNVSVWCTSGQANKIKRLDPVSGQVLAEVSTSAMPFRGWFDGVHNWVACFNANVVHKLDQTGAMIHTVSVGASPNWFTSDDAHLYVANYNGDSISVIDLANDQVVATWGTSAGSRPHGMARVDRELWVCCSGDHYIRVFDVTTGQAIGSVAVPPNPPGICFDGVAMWHGCGNANVMRRHVVANAW